MDKLKTVLMLLAVILGALAVLAVVGFIYSALQYLMLLAFLCLVGFIGVRLLIGRKAPELRSGDPVRELKRVERTLEEYKRKQK
jgi:hypothetical protein